VSVFTHFAAGALAGSLIPIPIASPFIGLGSHLLLDMIPHKDFEDYRLEIVLWVVAMIVLFVGGAHSAAIVLCGLFAVLPDLENLLQKTGKIRDDQKIFPGHRKGFIRHGRETGTWSVVLQVVFTAIVIVWMIRRNG
jgi:hypothetical protein